METRPELGGGRHFRHAEQHGLELLLHADLGAGLADAIAGTARARLGFRIALIGHAVAVIIRAVTQFRGGAATGSTGVTIGWILVGRAVAIIISAVADLDPWTDPVTATGKFSLLQEFPRHALKLA